MDWDQTNLIEYLVQDYIRHLKNYHLYLDENNEVDANWESAVCDYIFDFLKTVTGWGVIELADALQDAIDREALLNK